MTANRGGRADGQSLSTLTLFVFAATCGVAVGNVYFPQTLTPLLAEGFRAAPGTVAWLISAVQVGYAVGNYLVVPLGDRVPYRPLIGCLMAVCGLCLAAVAAAPVMQVAVAFSVLAGASTVSASVIGPMAAKVTPKARTGHVNGVLLSGSIAGMLLARTLAGAVGDWWGWRVTYFGAACATLVTGLAAAASAPTTRPAAREPYRQLLADPPRLVVTEPELRRSCLYQSTVFAGFTAIWSTIALLITGPAYRGSTTQVGLLALVNAITMLVTPLAGQWTDRHGSNRVNWISMSIVAAAAILLPAALLGGKVGWVMIITGTLLLDVGMQVGMVANQVRVYKLGTDAASRMNTAYMTSAYLGGSTGSLIAGALYSTLGWVGPCLELATLSGTALVMHLHHTHRQARFRQD